MKVVEQIERTKTEMGRAKPKSKRRVELELRLKNLVVRQLKIELRKAA